MLEGSAASGLLDGKAILKSLELPRGPIIGTYLEEQTGEVDAVLASWWIEG